MEGSEQDTKPSDDKPMCLQRNNIHNPYYALESLIRHRLDTYNLLVEIEKWQEDTPLEPNAASPELKKDVEGLVVQLKAYFEVLEKFMDIEKEKIEGIEKKVRE